MKDIIENAKKWALEEIEKYGSPSLLLFKTSNEKGQELAEKSGVDKDIVLIGTILMDIKLGQAVKEGKTQEHLGMSVEAVKKWLKDITLEEDKKKKIINCVEAHHGQEYECKEAEICANADCYKFLIPKNVIATICNLTKKRMNFEEATTLIKNKIEEKYKVLSLDICKQELEENYQLLKKLFVRLE
ncbi:hypothetical protein HN592_01015 [Candidatus Woesearchaeota archaeon]|jgi:hypothetical protein|nr:hypothetical protein [Candidatus Woesearchaeota archaeon]MBT4368885.1 hypothetical protein [Candidatus Woesearchaeota archaeon]MBT4712174.1 hypothetical protein [Candidatus Woesearchaeota archaeon]MBT6639078.1 hypothetical protein [Candidatus Woesearchaeota archaeon]MBT7134278.1 hypothetical protein [Candidatus Woesearchaeota archaeon]